MTTGFMDVGERVRVRKGACREDDRHAKMGIRGVRKNTYESGNQVEIKWN